MQQHLGLVLTLLLISLSAICQADGNGKEPWNTVSEALLPLSLAGMGYALFQDDPQLRETGRRMADTMIITTGAVLLTKDVIHSRRPRPSTEVDGFPSGHTAYAFALAEAVSAPEPQLRPWLYGYASLVGWSRVELNRHHWDQVFAGAAFGYLIGHQTGRGRWRLFGHRDVDLPASARASTFSLELASGLGARWDLNF